uniref:Phosphorylated adapter RNA export protein n=1 Tax=Davidia involucrata TaxID=16924 RepID=A0A5B6YY35_DAVIN
MNYFIVSYWCRLISNGLACLLQIHHLVDAIQACGGQKTLDGRRFRTGGGILWSILKAREPNAYKEIMKKGKEFEKQFRQAPVQNKDASSERIAHAFSDQTTASVTDDLQLAPQVQNQLEKSNIEGKRTSALDRIRVPVAYDDLLGEEDQKDAST